MGVMMWEMLTNQYLDPCSIRETLGFSNWEASHGSAIISAVQDCLGPQKDRPTAQQLYDRIADRQVKPGGCSMAVTIPSSSSWLTSVSLAAQWRWTCNSSVSLYSQQGSHKPPRQPLCNQVRPRMSTRAVETICLCCSHRSSGLQNAAAAQRHKVQEPKRTRSPGRWLCFLVREDAWW